MWITRERRVFPPRPYTVHSHIHTLCHITLPTPTLLGNTIDSGMDLSITVDKFRVFMNKTLSISSVYQ